jgi:hypothetical protein
VAPPTKAHITISRFQYGLGMTLMAKSDHSTGNARYCSYVLQSKDLVFAFTAPYSRKAAQVATDSKSPFPQYDQQQALDFIAVHGLAVRAVGECWADMHAVLAAEHRTSALCVTCNKHLECMHAAAISLTSLMQRTRPCTQQHAGAPTLSCTI